VLSWILALATCVAAPVLVCAVGWTSYLTALRLLRPAPTSVRASAATILSYWVLTFLFYALSPLGAFRLPIVLPTLLGSCALAHCAWAVRVDARATLVNDCLRGRELVTNVARSGLRWLAWGAAILILVLTLRASVAPPLGWDALTYHLVKAGRWVQAGGWTAQTGADAWSHYDYFPINGEVLWAWTMLIAQGDRYLGLAGIGVWLSSLLGTYTASRALGATEPRAVQAAIVLGFTPAVFRFVTTSYVDNVLLAAEMLSLVFVRRAVMHGSASDAVLALSALGFAAGVKPTALPPLGLGLTVVALAAVWRRSPAGKRVWQALACLTAAAVALPPYVRAWIDKGSPSYPFPLYFGSTQILAGTRHLPTR